MRNGVILLVSAALSLGLGIGVSATLPEVVGAGSDKLATPVTSDTLDYCRRLARELDVAEPASADARLMTEEGLRLCGDGHIRGGILRLRRAIVMVRAGQGR